MDKRKKTAAAMGRAVNRAVSVQLCRSPDREWSLGRGAGSVAGEGGHWI